MSNWFFLLRQAAQNSGFFGVGGGGPGGDFGQRAAAGGAFGAGGVDRAVLGAGGGLGHAGMFNDAWAGKEDVLF